MHLLDQHANALNQVLSGLSSRRNADGVRGGYAVTPPDAAPWTSHGDLLRTSERWVLTLLLVLGMTVAYVHRGALSALAPVLMGDLGLSSNVIGILLSAFYWTYACMQLPAGWLVDRIGVRKAYALGYALSSLAFISMSFTNSVLALIAVRMLMGIGQAVTLPASARAVANWFKDKERGMVTAGYLTGARLGQALIAFLTAYLLVGHGWRAFFIVVGILSLALWLPPWLQLLNNRDVVPLPGCLGDSRNTPMESLSFSEACALLKQRSVIGIFLGFFAYDYAWFWYTTWLPGYLSVERHFSLKETGLFGSVPFISMSGATLLSGFASDRLVATGLPEIQVRKVVVLLGLALACLVILAGLANSRMTSVYLMTISLAGLGIASPNTWTLTQCLCTKKIVGTVSGIQNFGRNVGAVLAPLLTGYIVTRTGSFALTLSITATLGAGMLAYGLLISERIQCLPSRAENE